MTRNERRRIAKVLREAVEIVHDAQDNRAPDTQVEHVDLRSQAPGGGPGAKRCRRTPTRVRENRLSPSLRDIATHSEILRRLLANAAYRGFVWKDLTVDVCVALANTPGPDKSFRFDIETCKLATRVCRMHPALHYEAPGEWISHSDSRHELRWYAHGLMTRNVQ